MSFGKSWNVKIADDIPIIGGLQYEFGMDEKLPIEVSIDEEGIVKVSYNKPEDQPMVEFGKEYKRIKDKAKNADFAAKAFQGSTTFGAGFFDADINIIGYGEGNISELEKGKSYCKNWGNSRNRRKGRL